MLIDTHAHIHFDEYIDTLESIFQNAKTNGIETIVTVGTNADDSLKALKFVTDSKVISLAQNIRLFCSAGIHPHDSAKDVKAFEKLKDLVTKAKYKKSILAIGECGLDYFKNFSSKKEQFKILELQLELANNLNLPVIFHVRDSWEDFFAILKNFPKIRGVIHSFTGHPRQVEIANELDLFFGINGIMTFTKDDKQIDALKIIPLDRLLLETDCPYLTPVPFRGKINQPSYILNIAEFVASTLNNSVDSISAITTQNAKEFFSI